MARHAIRFTLVGRNRFVKPSPYWRVSTAIWRVTPTTSAKGAMIGMATTVWPEPEPMNTLMNAFAMNIPTAAIALLKWLKGMEM